MKLILLYWRVVMKSFFVKKVSCNALEDKDWFAKRDKFLIDSGATSHVVNNNK